MISVLDQKTVNTLLRIGIPIILILVSTYPSRIGAEQDTWGIFIPNSIRLALEGSITQLDLAYDGSVVAVASDAGYVYLVGSDGRILWKTSMRAGISHLQGSLNLEWIVAVSRAMELSVYSYNGSLIDYRHSSSRAPARSLLYLYDTSTIVLLDELGWLYSYLLGDPVGRGEEWILKYSYLSQIYNVSISRFDPLSFTAMYPFKSPEGLTGEALVAVYARISDGRAGSISIYEAPLIRVYGFSGKVIENLFQLVLEDMRGYSVDFLIPYSYGVSKIIVVAGSNPANPDPKARFILRLYELPKVERGKLYTLTSSWSYSLGGSCRRLDIGSNGRYLVAISSNNQLYLFQRSTSSFDYMWSVSLGYTPSCMALESSPLTAAAGTADGWVYVVDESGEILWKTWLDSSTATSIDFSALGYRLAVGFSDGSLALIPDARVKRHLLELSLADPTGKPIPGANLTIASEKLELHSTTPISILLPVGLYTIVLDHMDIGIASIELPLASDLNLKVDSRLLAQPFYPLTFTTYDERNMDLKLSSYRVEAEGRLGLRFSATLTPLNSTITLPRDTYRIRVYADHYQAYEATLTLTSGMNITAPLKPETYTLRFTISSDLEGPLSMVRVELWWMDRLYGYIYTSPKGEAIIVAPYGDYTVKAYLDYYEPVEMPLSLEYSMDRAITLEPILYRVSVSVKGSDGLPVGLGSVKVYRAGKPYIEGSFTEGLYEALLPYGAYKFEFASVGWKKASIELRAPEKLSGYVTLQPEVYTLVLTVVDDTDSPLNNARVTLSGPTSLFSYTDQYGALRVEAVRGRYNISVSMAGYISTSLGIDLLEPRQIIVRLQPELLTVLWRHLPYILLLAVVPAGSLTAIILYLRRRRRIELEEIPEEELEVKS
ncbi:MAG: hypothetical protein QXQ29_02065 [Candidatus Bathyarchaeia archaeon]